MGRETKAGAAGMEPLAAMWMSGRTWHEIERVAFTRRLAECGGDAERAARSLGVRVEAVGQYVQPAMPDPPSGAEPSTEFAQLSLDLVAAEGTR